MCDFQIDYRFFNSKSSTIKTKKNMKMKCDFKCQQDLCQKFECKTLGKLYFYWNLEQNLNFQSCDVQGITKKEIK